jgi:hypothetical protein
MSSQRTLIVKRAPDRCRDERAALSSTDPTVESTYDLVVQASVQTHGHTMAHSVIRPDATVAAESDDLAVLEGEARRRGVTLSQLLREAVEHEAGRIRRQALPRFGVVRGDGTATETIAADEQAPARRS